MKSGGAFSLVCPFTGPWPILSRAQHKAGYSFDRAELEPYTMRRTLSPPFWDAPGRTHCKDKSTILCYTVT